MTPEYAQYVRETATSRPKDWDPLYTALGLCTEAGEAGDIIKKVFRRPSYELTEADRKSLVLELGDVLWYFTRLCQLYGVTYDEIIGNNILKLNARRAEGKNSAGG